MVFNKVLTIILELISLIAYKTNHPKNITEIKVLKIAQPIN